MGKRNSRRNNAVVSYPSHWIEHPEDMLTFIELPLFTRRRWRRLGLTDEALLALQILIMLAPRSGSVITGTGGLRKVRFSPPGWRKGKSSALRICYAYFESVATTVLAIVYDKTENDDLSNTERAAIRVEIERVEKLLLSRSYRYRIGH